MSYVIGIDLGTSAVKIVLVNTNGRVEKEIIKSYPLVQERPGFSEQDPEQWVNKTIEGLKELVQSVKGDPSSIDGISFSGQMHGLVLLDKDNRVLRNAILWNDTRTTKQCKEINKIVGEKRLLKITKNPALEGFTLPKLLWVKEHEPKLYKRIAKFLLPKDYLRFRLTEKLHTDYSDAAGTLLLDIQKKEWSKEICNAFDLPVSICPPLVESGEMVGNISSSVAESTGLSKKTLVFSGGADNACGAIGAGILKEGKTLCSIGTSGVVLSYENDGKKNFSGKVHYFNHGVPGAYYTMGVTLSAGFSLSWFKDVFAKDTSFEALLEEIAQVPAGSNGLLFTPYLVGERTPHVDSVIRSSFIGIDSSHERKHFVRAIIEGITFSLNESIDIFRANGKRIDEIVSIGGGAKSNIWLQLQADIFNVNITKLSNEQGPALGAAMLAAYGSGWFSSLQECAEVFLEKELVFTPIPENVKQYEDIYKIYQEIYEKTRELNEKLLIYR